MRRGSKSLGFHGGSDGKESACTVEDLGSIPGLGRSPGDGNGYPLQLAWGIPWTEEPGRLQPTESQRVGPDRDFHFDFCTICITVLDTGACSSGFTDFSSFLYILRNL